MSISNVLVQVVVGFTLDNSNLTQATIVKAEAFIVEKDGYSIIQ